MEITYSEPENFYFIIMYISAVAKITEEKGYFLKKVFIINGAQTFRSIYKVYGKRGGLGQS